VTDLDAMGPVDFVLIEWPAGDGPPEDTVPLILDLVDRGIIHLIDLTFLAKGEDGTVAELDISALGAQFTVFDGASAGVIGEDDVAEAGAALQPGTSAMLLVFENAWAAPFAVAMRKSGGVLVATDRIPTQALVAALDATETA
jgi:hypothetical protein